MAPPPIGSRLGDRYVLLEMLGEAPGHVEYRALDQELDAEIALWWLRPELFPEAARRDAVIGAGVELRHVNDVALRQCFGVGAGTGGLWAIWRLATAPGPAPGGEALSVVEVRRWIDAAGRGLGALHRHGLVHGRMTPLDVVAIGEGLKLGGGGLWRDAEPAAAARCWDAPSIAPEVARGQPPTEAADVWSFAAIVRAMIAGRSHPQLEAVLAAALHADPGRRPGLPELVEAARNAAEYPYASVDSALRLGGSAVSLRASGPARPPPVAAPAPPAPAPAAALPTPARTAIEAAADRARTAPPGQYVVQAVSLKTPKVPAPDVPTGETPILPRAKLRPLSEVASARTFSVAPGQLGYLAPPKAVSDAQKARRIRPWIVLALIGVLAAGVGVALALAL